MEFKAPSGAKVVVNPADWESTISLQSAISKDIAGNKFSLGMKNEEGEQDFSDLVRVAFSISGSSDVREALYSCLSRCTRSGEKITKETFEEVEARQDFIQICIECAKINLSPFQVGLRFAFSQGLQMMVSPKDESPKQK
tara:strand:- start:1242 stop:1661 length:420 start_codon:yes stop_codon:yes gene_type:complete